MTPDALLDAFSGVTGWSMPALMVLDQYGATVEAGAVAGAVNHGTGGDFTSAAADRRRGWDPTALYGTPGALGNSSLNSLYTPGYDSTGMVASFAFALIGGSPDRSTTEHYILSYENPALTASKGWGIAYAGSGALTSFKAVYSGEVGDTIAESTTAYPLNAMTLVSASVDTTLGATFEPKICVNGANVTNTRTGPDNLQAFSRTANLNVGALASNGPTGYAGYIGIAGFAFGSTPYASADVQAAVADVHALILNAYGLG